MGDPNKSSRDEKGRGRGRETDGGSCVSSSMNETDHLWDLERRFWLRGPEHFARALDPDGVMVFPFGVLRGAAITASLEGAPRWASVEIGERTLAQPTGELAVLAYRASGRRDGEAPYEAWCSSTYRRDGPGWRLVQHQQTPLQGTST